MRPRPSKILALSLALLFVLGAADALARQKKPRIKRDVGQTITRDYDGTPIIMRGLKINPAPGAGRDVEPPKRSVDPMRVYPRSNSSYVPPPVPSPSGGPPAPSALPQGPGVYKPPPIPSFID